MGTQENPMSGAEKGTEEDALDVSWHHDFL